MQLNDAIAISTGWTFALERRTRMNPPNCNWSGPLAMLLASLLQRMLPDNRGISMRRIGRNLL
jgi:hypothetical protein